MFSLIRQLPGRVVLRNQQLCQPDVAPSVRETRWGRRSRDQKRWGRGCPAAGPSPGTACLHSSVGYTLASKTFKNKQWIKGTCNDGSLLLLGSNGGFTIGVHGTFRNMLALHMGPPFGEVYCMPCQWKHARKGEEKKLKSCSIWVGESTNLFLLGLTS